MAIPAWLSGMFFVRNDDKLPPPAPRRPGALRLQKSSDFLLGTSLERQRAAYEFCHLDLRDRNFLLFSAFLRIRGFFYGDTQNFQRVLEGIGVAALFFIYIYF